MTEQRDEIDQLRDALDHVQKMHASGVLTLLVLQPTRPKEKQRQRTIIRIFFIMTSLVYPIMT